MTVADVIGALSLAAWAYLLAGRGAFWCARERDDIGAPARASNMAWPAVVAVIPARDEAPVIGRAVASLLRQDYPGPFRIVVVDDQSRDGTADIARDVGREVDQTARLDVVPGTAPPDGWAGKVWALRQGIDRARCGADHEYLLLTDADIEHAPDMLRTLVGRADAHALAAASIMARLRCRSLAERALIPAFVFFFAMLFPFRWVNRPRAKTAAAAGGCILVRRAALEAVGGIASIRDAIIDDCALAQRLKTQGPVWLGLSDRVVSLRAYEHVDDVRRMVARSAYAQLRYSPLLLAGTVAAMAMTFGVPPILALFAEGGARLAGAAAWMAMAIAFQPVLRFYRMSLVESAAWGLALPVIAAAYTAFTIESAIHHWSGRGVPWKGRVSAVR
jgi:hopene-associated glycosyltransferase HpnB